MGGTTWRLGLVAIWLVMAAVVYIRTENIYATSAAGLIACWNFARWVQLRSRAVPIPPRPRRADAPHEYNPELDFQKMDRDEDPERKA